LRKRRTIGAAAHTHFDFYQTPEMPIGLLLEGGRRLVIGL
jgi:hypothetical protein